MATLIDEIEVPDRPAIHGLRFRRFRGAADRGKIDPAENANHGRERGIAASV